MTEYIQSLLKYLLFPISFLYGIIIWVRNKLYDLGLFSSLKFDAIPVISVGNLSVGGTGKTPHIEYLIRLLSCRYHTATLSRGYGRSSRGFILADEKADARIIGDEPLQFKRKFPNIFVAVGEDRVTAIPELLQKLPFLECILLDDAFQHRSVKPGMNILLTEFDRPYTSDYILPLGRLREGRRAAKRADIILVTKCPENINEEMKQTMLERLKPQTNQQVFFTQITYSNPYSLLGNTAHFDRNTRAITFCAIANATAFVKRVADLTKDVHELHFRDHHYFTTDDIQELDETFKYIQDDNKCIFVTEKDASRLLLHETMLRKLNLPIIVIPISISFLFDEAAGFNNLINDYVYSYYTAPEFLIEEDIAESELLVDFEEID